MASKFFIQKSPTQNNVVGLSNLKLNNVVGVLTLYNVTQQNVPTKAFYKIIKIIITKFSKTTFFFSRW